MKKQYTKEELIQIYKKLPKELQIALFSEETANHVYNICTRQNIKEEEMPKFAEIIGRVILGLLPPEELQGIIEKELKIEKNIAKTMTHEINRFIFSPVKESLKQLYNMNISDSQEKPEVKEKIEDKTKEPIKEDGYREPIE